MKKVILTLAVIALLVPLMSAGFWDVFSGTGKASDQPQNVSVTVVGANPVVVDVPPVSAFPNELSSRTIVFDVNVSDADGVNDILTSSVSAEFTKAGQATRAGSCIFQNNINSNAANFTCSINLWYFDGPGSWNIRVEANDVGNGTPQNGTASFTYGELKAMVISPGLLQWPSLTTGAATQNASNDPTVVNNTGNYNGAISITAYDLIGESNPAENITASSFTVGAAGLECSGTALGHNASIVSGVNSNPGDLSLGGGSGQAFLYYCIPLVPSVSSQTYSTLPGGSNSWRVTY